MVVPKKKLKVVRNPAIRQGIVIGVGVVAILALILLLPIRWAILTWVIWIGLGVIGLIATLFLAVMFVATIGSVQYWMKHGYWYSPWAMGPWGHGPQGGQYDYDEVKHFEERP
ncbi:hypothetical protein SEA_A3WALLY_265 [Microbacterium phage A3Wally]|nr:hypothetical protein SEA_A3WALLY_265 [Microbacterium phage A3Wally]